MAYLLDTDVFIQAKNLYYRFDFCPAFWDWLIKQNELEKVFSIKKVLDELTRGNDELVTWAAARNPSFFLESDEAMLLALSQVSAWAHQNQQYEQAAVSKFLEAADYYLVAYALAHEHTVVTCEKKENSKTKIKIPNACAEFNIPCVTVFEMLQHERAQFILGPTN